jgi:hypothetical protein
MWVEFESLKPSSRIWIYQANRPLSTLEEIDLSSSLTDFCDQWMTHGHPLKSSFVIAHQQFIVLAADEDYQLPSGCSIDSSVRALKDWQSRNGADFFDRSLIGFKLGARITTLPLAAIKEKIATQEVTGKSITFDNLVPSKGDWETRWEIPLDQSWLSRYLSKTSVDPTP